MVALDAIQASNAKIKTDLPAGLVAVFIGATNGVGETTVREFARHANAPKAYIVGRSSTAGERVVSECQALNPEGTFVFIQKECHLMRNVDAVCDEIKEKEGKNAMVNLLFLTIGTLMYGKKTEEGLHYPMALTVYARSRFIVNLLPMVRKAEGLRRVVSVYGAGHESEVYMDDFESWNMSRPKEMGHLASITTLSLEKCHEIAKEVGFVHCFPGAVEGGIARGNIGPLMRVLKTIWEWLGSWVHVEIREAGERHLFAGTAGRFGGGGVEEEEVMVKGVDGKEESGVYSVTDKGETTGVKIEKILKRLRDGGMVETVWKRIDEDIRRALATNPNKL